MYQMTTSNGAVNSNDSDKQHQQQQQQTQQQTQPQSNQGYMNAHTMSMTNPANMVMFSPQQQQQQQQQQQPQQQQQEQQQQQQYGFPSQMMTGQNMNAIPFVPGVSGFQQMGNTMNGISNPNMGMAPFMMNMNFPAPSTQENSQWINPSQQNSQQQMQQQQQQQTFPVNQGQFAPMTSNQPVYMQSSWMYNGAPQGADSMMPAAPSNPVYNQVADLDRSKDKGSKFRGVSWNRRSKVWTARVWNPTSNKSEHLGAYDSELRAALCVDLKAISYYGEDYADLNFPDSEERQRLLAALTKSDINFEPLLCEMRDDPMNTIRKLTKRGQAAIRARYVAQRNKASTRDSTSHGGQSSTRSASVSAPRNGGSNKRNHQMAFDESNMNGDHQAHSSRSSDASSGEKESSSNGGRNGDGSSFDDVESGDGEASNGTNRSGSASGSGSTANSGMISAPLSSGIGSADSNSGSGSNSGSRLGSGGFLGYNGNGDSGDSGSGGDENTDSVPKSQGRGSSVNRRQNAHNSTSRSGSGSGSGSGSSSSGGK